MAKEKGAIRKMVDRLETMIGMKPAKKAKKSTSKKAGSAKRKPASKKAKPAKGGGRTKSR